MPQQSAGILMHRGTGKDTEVLLVHPGGPLWAKKDAGAWSIPKGLVDPGEDMLAAAKREFQEETGVLPEGDFLSLGTFKQPSGKLISVWSVPGDFDPSALVSNDFEMEWPPKSGKRARFPEVDRAGWFSGPDALVKVHGGQQPIVRKFFEDLGGPLPET
jgi:predicted NUDIX family NTP pyrophosphohydrolase